MTRGTVSHPFLRQPDAKNLLGDAFFGNNHSFNETLFEEVNVYISSISNGRH